MPDEPLQLAYHAHGEGPGWRKGEHLIDALPYIDPLTPDVRAQVDKLIEEEMKHSTKRPADYLKELPPMPPPSFKGHDMLVKEYNRVRAEEPMPPIDRKRFGLEPPPPSRQNDLKAWEEAVSNAHAQLEHQANRIMNLELLLKFGANSWRAQTMLDEAALKQAEAALQGLRRQVDGVNRERKLQQTSAGKELRGLEDQYYGAVRKNIEISLACSKVQEEVYRLRDVLGEAAPALQEGSTSQQQQQQQQQPGGVGEGDAPQGQQHANGVSDMDHD